MLTKHVSERKREKYCTFIGLDGREGRAACGLDLQQGNSTVEGGAKSIVDKSGDNCKQKVMMMMAHSASHSSPTSSINRNWNGCYKYPPLGDHRLRLLKHHAALKAYGTLAADASKACGTLASSCARSMKHCTRVNEGLRVE